MIMDLDSLGRKKLNRSPSDWLAPEFYVPMDQSQEILNGLLMAKKV